MHRTLKIMHRRPAAFCLDFHSLWSFSSLTHSWKNQVAAKKNDFANSPHPGLFNPALARSGQLGLLSPQAHTAAARPLVTGWCPMLSMVAAACRRLPTVLNPSPNKNNARPPFRLPLSWQ
jgi:hypothetical protein